MIQQPLIRKEDSLHKIYDRHLVATLIFTILYFTNVKSNKIFIHSVTFTKHPAPIKTMLKKNCNNFAFLAISTRVLACVEILEGRVTLKLVAIST